MPRPHDPLDDGADLPPPPERRLPSWVDAARRRMGLDARAWAWVAAVVVAVLAGAWLLRPGPVAVEETLPMASASSVAAGGATTAPPASSSSSSLPTEVVAHAAGAVVRPGVYALDPAARVDDLIRAAGGLAPDADGGRINLAAPLADGARVYVPRVGEGEAPPVVGPDGGPPPATDGAPPDEAAPAAPIDLNTATEAELDELPGVGPSIAAAIVAFREQNGGFASVEDLLDVRGIGEARLAEISPLVTV